MSYSTMTNTLKRYAAKLLFVFRVENTHGKKWCESRIVLFFAHSGLEALKNAKRKGQGVQWLAVNDDGNTVHGEFLGVVELVLLDDVTEDDNEVWYDIFESDNPESLIPKESELNAIKLKE